MKIKCSMRWVHINGFTDPLFCSMFLSSFSSPSLSFSIWLKSDLYLRYCIEDLITPHRVQCKLYWPISCYFYATESRLKDFHHLQKYCTAFKICYLIGQNHETICKYQVHWNTISYWELSDPLCDSVNRDLTQVRLSLSLSVLVNEITS